MEFSLLNLDDKVSENVEDYFIIITFLLNGGMKIILNCHNCDIIIRGFILILWVVATGLL